ncbi:MAG: hypothetical protein DDT26_00094 [Dehalococcoidia bacterium]|nr:hypothetical protein [Chloroflexota bacterium]
MFGIPRLLTSGDTVRWLDGQLQGTDPATGAAVFYDSTTCDLSYTLVGPEQLTINGVPGFTNREWNFSVNPLELTPGLYTCVVQISRTIEPELPEPDAPEPNPEPEPLPEPETFRLTLATFQIVVRPNLLAAQAPIDARSQTQRELDALDEAILSITAGKVSSYQIKGRMAAYHDLELLQRMRERLRLRLAREQGNSDKVYITWGPR